MFYLPRSSILWFKVSCFLPEISTSDLVLTLRNKNNIDVDNNFTLDSTFIPIVQLKVKKKIIKYVIRYPKQNLKKSLNLGLIQM